MQNLEGNFCRKKWQIANGNMFGNGTINISFAKELQRYFGAEVFDGRVAKKHLPNALYRKLFVQNTPFEMLSCGEQKRYALCLERWAISRGAYCFGHYFCDLQGKLATKQTSFLCDDGKMRLSPKDILSTDADASSFDTGRLCSTFDAKGVAKWNGFPPFVQEGCLHIPANFFSGKALPLDNQTALEKSCVLLQNAVEKLCERTGFPYKNIQIYVGCEQEFFLLEQDKLKQRPDLRLCQRDLVGGILTEANNHYYAPPTEKIQQFEGQLQLSLAKLGIVAKTQHGEAGVCQFEAVTQHANATRCHLDNVIVMQKIQKVANGLGLQAIFREKPFNSVNGSGKHVNWSVSVDGVNLLKSDKNPRKNALFLLFLSAILQGVYDNQSLLRACCASYHNDLRLGKNEAPPHLISVFLGKSLTSVLEKIAMGNWNINSNIPQTDDQRNRTCPIALVGDKIEMRILGSSMQVAPLVTAFNCAVAKALLQFTKEVSSEKDILVEISKTIAQSYKDCKRILYNGDCYHSTWRKIAKLRKLKCLPNTPCALQDALQENNLLQELGIYSQKEVVARIEVATNAYCNAVKKEVYVASQMVKDITYWCDDYCAFAQLNGAIFAPQKAKKVAFHGEICKNLVYQIEILAKSGSISHCQKAGPLLSKLRYHTATICKLLPSQFWKMPTNEQILTE